MTLTLLEPLWRSKQERIWREGGKCRIKMTKRPTGFLKEEEVHVMINKNKRLMKGEVHIVILNQTRKLLIKGQNPTVKISQGRRLPRGY